MKNENVRFAIQGTAALNLEPDDREATLGRIIDFSQAREASSHDNLDAALSISAAQYTANDVDNLYADDQYANDLAEAVAYIGSSAASSLRESRSLLSSGSAAGCGFGVLKPWQTVVVLGFFSVAAFLIAFVL